MSRRAPLTWLYAPGDQPELIAKALASEADCVIIDLEDAVTPDRKDGARDNAVNAALDLRPGGGTVQIRINQMASPWFERDVPALSGLDPAVGVRVPKCERPEAVAQLAESVGDRRLHLLVESALGLDRAMSLATATLTVASIGLGEADLQADLGVAGDEGLAYARGRLVAVAAAAGLPPPAMSVFTDVRDTEGLLESCRLGRRLGFLGRAAIHPAQLPVIREAFTPSRVEVVRAREVVGAAADGVSSGAGALALADGRFVDEAVVRQARRLLDLTDN